MLLRGLEKRNVRLQSIQIILQRINIGEVCAQRYFSLGSSGIGVVGKDINGVYVTFF